MANLVSIDWSIEEFRRLISEQPQPSKAGSSIETSVDVAAPTSATTDRAPPFVQAPVKLVPRVKDRAQVEV